MSRAPAPKKSAGAGRRVSVRAIAGWGALGALAVAVLGAPQLAAWLGRGAPADGEVRYANGYTQIIDDVFAPMGWLVHHEEVDDTGAPQTQVVTLSDDAYRNTVIWNFYRQSFLRGDILADDAKLWRFNGPEVQGIQPWSHAEPGPFQAVHVWRGDITYRDAGQPRPGLTWSGGETSFDETADPVDWSGLPAMTLDGRSAGQPGSSGGVRFVDETGANLAAAIPVGQTLLLRVLPSAGVNIAVNGKSVIAPSDGAAYVALQQGDALSFTRNGAPLGRTFIVRVASGAISHFEPFADRQRDPAMAFLATALETALNAAADQGASSGLAPPPLVRTTLDRDLQEQLQRLLSAEGDQVKGATGGRDFPAAATVMDTNTGEVLALASYPDHAAAGQPPPPNENFKLLPIGSIAKAPFSASILSAHPQLQSLVIVGATSGTFRTLLGIDLKNPFPEDATAAKVDFPTFLIQSSNKYASTLMLLSSAADPLTPNGPATPEPYDLGGPRTHLPRIAFHERPDKDVGFGAPVDGLAGPLSAVIAPDGGPTWITRLSGAFDLPNAEKLAGDANLYDFGDWSVLTHGWDDTALRALADVSPERESFGLNAIGDLRDDYLSLILGGGRSRWSTLRVAEVFSRLVTMRQVSPQLATAGDGPATRPAPVEGLDPASVGAILSALSQVPRIGTARLVAPALKPLEALAAARGEELRIFAKTGTPRLQRPYRSDANRAVDALIRLRYLQLQRGYLRLVGAPSGQSMADFFAHETRIRDELSEVRVSPADAAAYVTHINNDLSASDRAARLSIGPDGLDGLNPDLDTDPYSGGALAFVVGRWKPGAANTCPIRALTVVINVQQKPKSAAAPNPATEMAAKLLSSDLFQARLFAPGDGGGC